ncbi:hypothetical protein ACI3KS_03355 [Microbacterium sp. ZW T5_45]|uniref:hypothetical protein n=1 Tax=Microbacterium sp. ZW T5_45 TaxID=3378080 RepID=UPI0038555FE5
MAEERPQHVEKVPGSRRARLTAVPGTDPEPESGPDAAKRQSSAASDGAQGPNDQRMLQDVPPHY